jgi:hypothetical protein
MIFNIIFITGCNKDNPLTPSQHINISGKVTDYWGDGVSNIRVELNSAFKQTSSDGSFTFSEVVIPYDITVYTWSGTEETFRNLSTANPILSTDRSGTQFDNNTDITVILPPFNNNQNATVIFYDNSGIYQSNIHLYNTNYATMNHRWNGNPSSSGIVAVWIYTTNNSGNTISFDNYGEKPLTINSGEEARIVFNTIDLSTSPYDSIISGMATLPQGFTIEDISIGMNRFSFANMFNYGNQIFNNAVINNMNFYSHIPLLSGNVYKYYACTRIHNQGNNKNGIRISEISPHNPNNIQFSIFPSLISPADNEPNVNYETTFSFSKDYPQGIYKVNLRYLNGGFYNQRYFYINSETFRLSALSDTSSNIPDNTECIWSVTKISGFTSTDDYTSKPIAISQKYNELLTSEERKFIFKLTNKK